MKKAFTLVEVLISTVIIGLLIILIFQIYAKITSISIRIDHEKSINNELLFVFQTIQNISDNNNIDFDKYIVNGNSTLSGDLGFTGNLYTTGIDLSMAIYVTGTCNDGITYDPNIQNMIDGSKSIAQIVRSCDSWIEMDKNGKKLKLTDPNKVYIGQNYFKIIPSSTDADFDNIYHNSFWIFGKMYIKRFDPSDWAFNVSMPYQTFFNIRKY